MSTAEVVGEGSDGDDGVVLVRLRGELDVGCAREVRAAIDEAVGAAGVTRIELDMAEVSFIDSTGIGVLVGAMQRARAEGQELEIVAASSPVRRVLDMTGVGFRFS